jgi:hypothetical protein
MRTGWLLHCTFRGLLSVHSRRKVLLGLNKGELLNDLAGKLFFGGQGEMNAYEDQLNAASSLNLFAGGDSRLQYGSYASLHPGTSSRWRSRQR